jgi:O-antigen ligase
MATEQNAFTRGELLMNGWVFAILSLMLVMPSGPAALGIGLAVMGLVAILQGKAPLAWAWQSRPLRVMAIGVFWFMAAGVFLGVWYKASISYYEAFAPFLLTPLMLSGVLLSRLPSSLVWTGSATGALLGGIYASYQSLVLLSGRATGNLPHPIIFGDLAVVLSCMALFGVLYFETAQRNVWLRAYLLLCTLMGVWASLLSGTKGGWLSIVMFLFIFVWRLTTGHRAGWRWASAIGLVAILIATVLLAPKELVWNRLAGMWHHALNWFQTGEVTDWSVSIRLELWSYAWQLFAERPLLGWSGDEAMAKLADHLRPFNVPPGVAPVFENDLLHYAAVSGLVGVTSVLALYVGVFRGFWQFQKQSADQAMKAFALMGMLLVLLIFEFGLTVNALGRSSFRYFFCDMTVILLGLILMSRQQRTESSGT